MRDAFDFIIDLQLAGNGAAIATFLIVASLVARELIRAWLDRREAKKLGDELKKRYHAEGRPGF